MTHKKYKCCSHSLLLFSGSDEEKKDLKRAYLNGKGDMDYIVDHVQFARSEHEERHKEILHASYFSVISIRFNLFLNFD